MKDLMSKEQVIAAFTLLGEQVAREDISLELFAVGGAAIIFAHEISPQMRGGLTHDVDVVIVQPNDNRLSKVRGLIGQVGEQLQLPAGWLNDSAAKFVTHQSDGPVIFQSKGILVRRATDSVLKNYACSAL